MRITVSTSLEPRRSTLRALIQSLLANTLQRFSTRISQVSVLVTDENGPRGGVDKLCRIHLLVPGMGAVTTTARHERPLVAVAEAARRARRVVVDKLKRPRSLRARRRSTDPWQLPLDTHNDSSL